MPTGFESGFKPSARGFVRPKFDKTPIRDKVLYGVALSIVVIMLYVIALGALDIKSHWSIWILVPFLILGDPNMITVAWFKRPAWLPTALSFFSAAVWMTVIFLTNSHDSLMVLLVPMAILGLDIAAQSKYPFRAFLVALICSSVPEVGGWGFAVALLIFPIWYLMYHHTKDIRLQFQQDLERTQNTLQLRIRQLQVSEKGAFTDMLTQLLNRRGFTKAATDIFADAAKDNRPVGFIFFDIDHFKQVNDTYGHDKGDIALKTVAKTVNNTIRPHSDYLARVGGEEFIIMTMGVDTPEKLGLFAERVRQVVERTIWDKDKTLTISLGYSLYPDNGAKTLEECIKCADIALYVAKESGRNRSVLYSPGMAKG